MGEGRLTGLALLKYEDINEDDLTTTACQKLIKAKDDHQFSGTMTCKCVSQPGKYV